MEEGLKIKGSVTIDIETFEKLKSFAESAESANQKLRTFRYDILGIIDEIFDTDYLKRMEEIDNEKGLSDRQIEKKVSESYKELVLYIDKTAILKLIQKAIQKDEVDEVLRDIKNATMKELQSIDIIFVEKEE